MFIYFVFIKLLINTDLSFSRDWYINTLYFISRSFINKCKHGVLQYAFFRLITTIIALCAFASLFDSCLISIYEWFFDYNYFNMSNRFINNNLYLCLQNSFHLQILSRGRVKFRRRLDLPRHHQLLLATCLPHWPLIMCSDTSRVIAHENRFDIIITCIRSCSGPSTVLCCSTAAWRKNSRLLVQSQNSFASKQSSFSRFGWFCIMNSVIVLLLVPNYSIKTK